MSTSIPTQLGEAFNELDALTKVKGKLSNTQEARCKFLVSKIAALRSGSMTTDEEIRARAAAAAKDAGVLPEMEEFRKFLLNDSGRFLYPHERRTYSGMNTGTGANGGYFVPAAYM